MRKKFLQLFLILCSSIQLMAQDCPTTALNLISQNQVDSFQIIYPNCTELQNDLFIGMSNSNITSLENLSQLVSIDGDLDISGTNQLSNLNGLHNITTISGGIEINENSGLTNLGGVENLEKIRNLRITKNPMLTDLNGFISLDSIEYDLFISRNGTIPNLNGFSSLVSVRDINLGIPSSLNSSGVQSLDGLQALTNFRNLNVTNSNLLVDLAGLQNLVELSGLIFFNVNSLPNLSGLESLETIENIAISNCHSLENINGLIGLQTVTNNFVLNDNELLTDCIGLDNLTQVKNFSINFNEGMTSLEGLENLEQVDGMLEIKLNYALTEIDAIENLNLVDHLDSLILTSNTLLSVCNYENICNYLTTGGAHSIAGNNVGCENLGEIINSCLANQDITRLQGKVWADLNSDCAFDSGDVDIPNILLQVESNLYNYTFSADSLGNYDIPVLAGDYTLSIISPSSFWTACFEDSLIVATAVNDTIITDFFLQPQGDCPYVDWTVNLNPLRICGTRTATLDFCNLGAELAEDILFTLDLPEYVTLDSASYPYATNGAGEIIFMIDSLDLFDCRDIRLYLFTDCDSVELNEVLCMEVELDGDELCAPDPLWDGSITKVSGYCENDSIYFQLENIGSGNMLSPAEFRVNILIEDIVLLIEENDYQLEVGEIRTLAYEAEGVGFYIEADQTVGNPVSTKVTSAVPNCEDIVNDIILTLFPNNNGDPFSETFCTYAVNSYDPNAKIATPRGVGAEHFIEKNWELDYTIQFQNTGNDVAYLVEIRDTLSENLDLNTLRVHGASHDFTWALQADRELVFTFENILLPDSTSNEPASHGVVNYSISPQEDILPLEKIENSASIYFDSNDPILTNTVFHTIRKPVVSTSDTLDWCIGSMYNSILLWQDTAVLEITEFVMYDSAHVTYLNVVDTFLQEAFVEVTIGDVFENIEIMGDTIFTITHPSSQGCDSIVIYNISALPVGTKDLEKSFEKVKVFPNPAAEFLIIEMPDDLKSVSWTLTNTLGVLLFEKINVPHKNVEKFSLENIDNGIYWLEGKSAQGKKVWKIVVNK